MTHPTRTSIAAAHAAVENAEDGLYAILVSRPELELGFYRPQREDGQQPHDRDEVYVVASGSGRFFCDGTSRDFVAGDALFVAAGACHRFEDFSDDFATWVMFGGRPDAIGKTDD